MEKNNYIKKIITTISKNEEIIYIKEKIENYDDINFLMDLYFYNDVSVRKNNEDKDVFFNFIEIRENKLFEELKNRVYQYTKSQNIEYCKNNIDILSGYAIYYANRYNLFMFSSIILFVLVFGEDLMYRLNNHLDFLKMQKRSDGRIGYINPLKKFENLNKEYFHTLNEFLYTIIFSYLEGLKRGNNEKDQI